MKILVVGSGGREHALAWKMLSSKKASELILAPGNAGSLRSLKQYAEKFLNDQAECKVWSLDWSLSAQWKTRKDGGFDPSVLEFAKTAKQQKVDLVIVGNEDASAAGLVDACIAEQIPVFGPTRAAARLEASKSFAKEIMAVTNVPTAPFYFFRKVKSRADFLKMIESCDWSKTGWVIKADGLALGKGVVVCQKKSDAIEPVERLLETGSDFLMEQKIGNEGAREVSIFAVCDGENAKIISGACDYKRLLDFDRGPNTGGMGAYSPVPWLDDGFYDQVREEVFLPVLKEMKKRGTPFCGILFAGLMVEKPEGSDAARILGGTKWKSPRYWVIEFNVRWGDPEAQVLLPRWCATKEGAVQALKLFHQVALVQLGRLPVAEGMGNPSKETQNGAETFLESTGKEEKVTVTVAGVAPGYPELPEKGAVLRSTAESYFDDFGTPKIFFGGVKENAAGELVVNGGRVLYGLGMATEFSEARRMAYKNLRSFGFPNMVARADIASREE